MKRSVLLIVLGLILCPLMKSQAATMEYESVLVDPVSQKWQYSYSVSGVEFNSGFGFTIYFNTDDFSWVQETPPTVNTDWDILTWQPDLMLPGDGAYDACAQVDSASLVNPFIVSCQWIGNVGCPGSQYYEIYSPEFETLISGYTIPANQAVPVPPPVILMGSGLLSFWGSKRMKIKV